MAISLSDLKTVEASEAPRLLIYGPPGIGKTTLASEFPNPVFLQVEDGTPGDLKLTSFGKLDSYDQVIGSLQALYDEDHNHKTIVIDSVTEMQKLIFAETCRRGDDKGNAKANIEDFGYGKGYVYAKRVWDEFITGLNMLRTDKGMCIILIAHSTVVRFDDPETVSYDKYEIDLHKHSVGAIEREMDAIFLLKQPVTVKTEESGFNKSRARAEGGGVVLIHTGRSNAFTAKNRYGMPPTLRYDKGKGYEVMAPYFPNNKVAPVESAEEKEAA